MLAGGWVVVTSTGFRSWHRHKMDQTITYVEINGSVLNTPVSADVYDKSTPSKNKSCDVIAAGRMETSRTDDDEATDAPDEYQSAPHQNIPTTSSLSNLYLSKTAKRPRVVDEDKFEKEVLGFLKTHGQREPNVNDEDETFILSLVPTIKKFTVVDKLDFQVKFMELIQSYLMNSACSGGTYQSVSRGVFGTVSNGRSSLPLGSDDNSVENFLR
ncbi:Hypothetical protein NTJ_02057 [Nesidiocoris tenuis]|uniref:BESS domain-containing protein n=1 Tax=Nesidiocoris tenuis TaxID=355587 RepID=A0ABN7AEG6_9HEMI|nr:Hypothetical protein NTJ_02057 [Nesidiocoris tenuis]